MSIGTEKFDIKMSNFSVPIDTGGGNQMKRILTIFIVIVIIIGIIFVFFKNNDKIKNLGNNISTTEDLQNYILNITSYEAEVEVTIESNKTSNKYKLNQKYSKERGI